MAGQRPSMVAAAEYRGSLFPKLGKLLNEACSMPARTKVELESMEEQLKLLLASSSIIGDVELRLVEVEKSVWLCHTMKLLYDAENLVDSLLVPADEPAPAAENTSSPPEMADAKIKKITDRGLSLMSLLLKEGSYTRALYKHEEETELVGIDGPRDELIKMLAAGDGMPEEKMRSVSIVGIGGSGKTTLARIVYNQLKPQFDCGAFVRAPAHEPDDFQKDALKDAFFREMLSQLDVENHMDIRKTAFGYGKIVDGIKQFLQNKRYLIVIDDTLDATQFRDILSILENDVYGSRIISTFRIDMINKMGLPLLDDSVYEIKSLGYLESRKLFLKHFCVCESSFPHAPMDALNQILKMCGGRPSAIICTALVLATRVTATKPWEEMLNSVYCAWKQMASFVDFESDHNLDFGELIQILLLPYSHLPCSLKNCLLHLVVQAKTQMIHRATMVRKWIAEGFIDKYGGCSDEELASWYFDELIGRNFIQLVESGNLGEEIYEVNYMMHNVLWRLSQEDNFATVFSDSCTSREYGMSLRLSIKCSCAEHSVYTSRMHRYIRSITVVGPVKFYVHTNLWSLRVLDLDGCRDLDNSAMGHICCMIDLRYLSLKHTQVTEIPPVIRKLQKLKTLDIRQTEISNLPPEIGELQDLETLDVRQTQVIGLQMEIFQLPRLAHLYYGNSSSPREVKLPMGTDQWKSLNVLDTVDSIEGPGSAMDETSELAGVREFKVVLHDHPADKDKNDKLLSSISKYENLVSLIVHGDYNPSDELPVSTKFPLLERLKVAGRFVKVPRWLEQLTTLKQLYVRVCKLDRDDLKILGGLPVLSTLALALICIPWKKEVTIPIRLHSSTCTDLPPLEETCNKGFMSLEIFSFDCRVPWITFELGAMPRLKQLHLKLYACPADKFPSGLINLDSLEMIIIQYSSEYASNGGVTKAVAAVREEASRHDNLIRLCVNGNNEVFLSNSRVHETKTGTETKKASNQGNLVEPSVNGDREVLLSNTWVDETRNGTEIEECH